MKTAPSMAIALANDITDRLARGNGSSRSAAFLDYVWRFVHATATASQELETQPSIESVLALEPCLDTLTRDYFALWLDREHPGWQDEMLAKGTDKQTAEQAKKSGHSLDTMQMLAFIREKAWRDQIADALGSLILSSSSSLHHEMHTAFYVLRQRGSEATQPAPPSHVKGGLQ